ncbi:hypothetical protein TVAG_151200 [Trichomonas vaginalis G3]|uniref:Uncharacterized protein n=1 Tax=Trichomonas vaginalis (strain ATCC PRA-98 / G3) TaxID=412133 RepID=A2EQB7_TRIV3|nr:hypothetical protein TVAGG3_0726430 [Trichomonas vaginalis G3]EAY05133.1 hypothetical protein TVAG_151200 [Trichomonas vaginalis G3]KAI5510943.1 hypothetical protein TVAGG3_0726430 [Trichomonas vaginalis G3]|eukprot:XP_001317356.1 hypothetical protein [Trichomonas vaginalis G3]
MFAPQVFYQNGYRAPYSYSYNQPMMPIAPQAPPTPPKIPSLTIELPTYTYVPTKQVIIPFDKKLSHNGMFNSMDEAMSFLSKHCIKYHGQFTRQLARVYSKLCYVLDLVNGTYCPMNDLSKKDFNAAFLKFSKMN